MLDSAHSARMEAAEVGPNRFVVTANGALDHDAALELRDLLLPLIAADGAHIVVDLAGVTSLHDASLRVVASAAILAHEHGEHPLVVVNKDPWIHHMLVASGLEKMVQMERTLEEGIAHVS
ncbi:MAG TPA: STAS domain-containing protein [Gaiellaceae bacterium]|nr:STAS domain-containing protein [Gaiellaceae bacterium]